MTRIFFWACRDLESKKTNHANKLSTILMRFLPRAIPPLPWVGEAAIVGRLCETPSDLASDTDPYSISLVAPTAAEFGPLHA